MLLLTLRELLHETERKASAARARRNKIASKTSYLAFELAGQIKAHDEHAASIRRAIRDAGGQCPDNGDGRDRPSKARLHRAGGGGLPRSSLLC